VKLRRFAGVSEAGARSRNPERSEGTRCPERVEGILRADRQRVQPSMNKGA